MILSQNLITNGSFENISQCPDNGGQLEYALNWLNPTSWGTPDLFNICSNIMGIPSYCNCDYAFQYAKSGNSYAGIYTYGFSVPDGREYIQKELNANLTQNQCYKVTFFVNLSNGSKYATNNLDIYLSTNQISSGSTIINLIPSIAHNKVILDTLNWIEISGIFEANGNEQFITIGNFKNDNNTDTLRVNENTPIDAAYYNIDDVSVIAISDLPNSMPASAGPDIDLTLGDSVFIGQEISNLNCTWSILGGSEIADSISGIYVQPTLNTTYVVEQNLCGVITYDTVNVFVHGVGVSSLEGGQRSVTIYPNPNNGSFEIDLSQLNNSLQEISILDASGRIVFEDKSVLSKNKLSIQAHLEKGVYFLRVSSENGVFEEKIIIQ